MLGVGPLGGGGIEMPLRERVGELGLAALQVVEIGVVGEEVEDKDFHSAASMAICGVRPATTPRMAIAAAAISDTPQALRKICGGGPPRLSIKPPTAAPAMPPSRQIGRAACRE